MVRAITHIDRLTYSMHNMCALCLYSRFRLHLIDIIAISIDYIYQAT